MPAASSLSPQEAFPFHFPCRGCPLPSAASDIHLDSLVPSLRKIERIFSSKETFPSVTAIPTAVAE